MYVCMYIGTLASESICTCEDLKLFTNKAMTQLIGASLSEPHHMIWQLEIVP